MPSTYTRFSDITINNCKDYLRLLEVSTAEETLLSTMLEAAKSHVLTFTGRTAAEADEMPEMTVAVYAVVQDMYDKRAFTIEEKAVNKVIEAILGSRSINLL